MDSPTLVSSKMSMIRLLLRFDRHTAYAQNENGFTALHITAYHDYDEMLNEILECCVDCCKLVDKRGWNTLHHAVKRNSDKTIKLLLSYPPLRYLLNDKDENGNTPFSLGGFVRRLVYSAVSHLPPWCGSDGIQQRKPKCTRPCFRKSCRKGIPLSYLYSFFEGVYYPKKKKKSINCFTVVIIMLLVADYRIFLVGTLCKK